MLKRLHYFSGIIITLFVGLHLFNHLMAMNGINVHIEWMNKFRPIYRNPLVEVIILIAVIVQVYSGIKLIFIRKKQDVLNSLNEKWHNWSGLYLALFLIMHISAVFVGRTFLKLDTNFYFGAAGLNEFPANLFFIPYYSLAIVAFFIHIACVHSKKMKFSIFGISPAVQATLLVIIGFVVMAVILFAATNGFSGHEIPEEYKLLK